MYARMRYTTFHRPLFFLTFVSLYVLAACSMVEDIDKIKEPEWHPEIAVSLVNSRISLGEILAEFDRGEYLTTDSSGQLTVVYEDPNVYTTTTAGMLVLPDALFPMFDTVLIAPAPSQQGERISRLQFSSATLSYAFASSQSGLMRVQIFLPNVTRNGQSFVETVTLTSPDTRTGSVDLSGYEMAFTDDQIEFRYRATLIATGERVLLDNMVLGLGDLSYSYAEGYLGRYEFAIGSDQLDLDFFDLWQEGGISFQEPSLQLRIENTAGVPIRIRTDRLDALTENGAISIASEALSNGVSIAYPDFSEVGTAAYTTITLDRNNSNLAAALASNPYAFAFDFEAVAFADEDPAELGFITDESAIHVALTASLPLFASVADIGISDTFEMALEDVDRLTTAGFRLITENGFPMDMAVQVYFLDAQHQIIDSLQSGAGLQLSAASVDANGKATQATEDIQEVQIESGRLAALQRAVWISYKATIDSPQDGSVPVRLYEDYELAIKLGIKVGL